MERRLAQIGEIKERKVASQTDYPQNTTDINSN